MSCRAHGADQCLTCRPVEETKTQPRAAVPHEHGKMNKTEKRYAMLLEGLKRANEILDYRFEGMTLRLGPDCRYTPDFMVVGYQMQLEFHEVKGGYAREDSLVKLRAAAGAFPWFRFKLCRYQKGNWEIKEI